VRALVRKPEKARVFEGFAVEVVVGDFNKPETLDAALRGVDRAIFITSSINLNQVELVSNFIEAAKRADTKHLVKYSGIGADPDSPSLILRGHWQIEKQLENSGIPFTILRPNLFMQNVSEGMPAVILQGDKFYRPVKDGKVSLVDIRDVAMVAVKVLTENGHEGKTYTITGPEALSYYECAEKLSAVLGKPITYVPLSPEGFQRAIVENGMPQWFAEADCAIYLTLAGGGGSFVTNIVEEVAKKQPITYDQFVQDYAQVLNNNTSSMPNWSSTAIPAIKS
jgi:uncharacterized protein YbjT (DUF2867 family)